MIFGEQVRLRAMEKDHIPYFVQWLNDPEVRQNISLVNPLSLTEEEEWYAEVLKSPPWERPLSIEIQPDPKKESWVLVGNCGFMKINWLNRYGEIGIQIGEKKYWDRGFGTRAVKLLVGHGFQTLNLHRVWLRVYETNSRAIRAYEKAGFTHEGRFREAQFQNGSYQDVLIMGLLSTEWQDGKP
jgi:diamine N-acetyltransferase